VNGVNNPDLGSFNKRSVAAILLGGPIGGGAERLKQLHDLHLGNLQWMHSMSSTEKTAVELRDKIVAGLTTQFKYARKEFESGHIETAFEMVGQLLHTVQDSYSESHTKRDPTTGKIMSYYDFTKQDSKLHAEADKVDGAEFYSGKLYSPISIDEYPKIEKKAGVAQATIASKYIIRAFLNNDATAFREQLDATYLTSPNAEVGKGGAYSKEK
jgi:hypothetical protein